MKSREERIKEIEVNDEYYPDLCDKSFFDDIKKHYPEKNHLNYEEFHNFYCDGSKYATCWDHIREAYNYYEPLADRFLESLLIIKEQQEEIEKLKREEGEKLS